MGYRPGDCLTLDIPELGLSSQAAIITRRSLDPATGVVTPELKSETPGKHDYALGRTGTPPPTPTLAVPDLSAVAAPDATDWQLDRKGPRLNSSHSCAPAQPSPALKTKNYYTPRT